MHPPRLSDELNNDQRTVLSMVHVTDRVSCDICGYSQESFPKLLPTLARRHVELHCRILQGQRRAAGVESAGSDSGLT